MSRKKNKPALITSNDEKGIHFLGLCAVAYNKAKLNKDQAQQLNEKGGEFQTALGELIDRFSMYNQFPIQAATEILGVDKVVEFRDVVRAWGITMPANNPTIPYSCETLRECAEENKRGVADWRLVYVNGFSLRKQEEIRGRNRMNQPCFNLNNTWWLHSGHKLWANQAVNPGYRLLNFKKNFSNMSCEWREKRIDDLGERFEMAEEQAVAEACFSIFMIKKERLMEDWCHQGFSMAGDDHVFVGFSDKDGFEVRGYYNSTGYHGLGAVLYRTVDSH